MASGSLHSVTWLVWVLSAATAVELAPNPLYVALVVGAAATVVVGHRVDTALARAFPVLVGFGVFFAVVRVVITALTTRSGGPHLVALPAFEVPSFVGGFTVGGPVETDVVVQAAAAGFAIVGVMAVFGAFNAVVSHHELVQVAPRAFYEAGLVLSVSLAFVPSVVTTVQRVRDADRARLGGARPPRRRSARLLVPVLESALERAVALSESMDSRGFGRGAPPPSERAAGMLALAGLVALVSSFVALVGERTALAGGLAVSGAALVAAAVTAVSRGPRRPRYRARRLAPSDFAVMAASLMVPVVLGGLRLRGEPALGWLPGGAGPAFDPLSAAALLLLAVPALMPAAPLGAVRAEAAVASP